MESLPLKVLDFGLQMPTGPRQIEETRFAFIHAIDILYSADTWHEVMLFFTLWLVLQLWNVPTLKSHISKTFFTNNKKQSFYIIRMPILCSTLVQRDLFQINVLYKINFLLQMVKGELFQI